MLIAAQRRTSPHLRLRQPVGAAQIDGVLDNQVTKPAGPGRIAVAVDEQGMAIGHAAALALWQGISGGTDHGRFYAFFPGIVPGVGFNNKQISQHNQAMMAANEPPATDIWPMTTSSRKKYPIR